MDLLHDPVVEHCDALSERHRLDLVVSDVERRPPEPLVSLTSSARLLHPVEAHRRVIQVDPESGALGNGEPAVLQREGLAEDPVDER